MKPVKVKKDYYKFSFETYDSFWQSIVASLSKSFDKKNNNEIFFHCSRILSIDDFLKIEDEFFTGTNPISWNTCLKRVSSESGNIPISIKLIGLLRNFSKCFW